MTWPSDEPTQPQRPAHWPVVPGTADEPPTRPDPYAAAVEPGYPQPALPGYRPDYAGQPGTNTMAVVAFVFALLFWPVGLVLGHIAKRQISRTGEGGGGLATAALVISYLLLGLMLCGCLGAIVIARSS